MAAAWPCHEVLGFRNALPRGVTPRLPGETIWSESYNEQWVRSVIARGLDVYIASELTEENLWNSRAVDYRTFFMELVMFDEAGYVEDGHYLSAPER